MSSEYKKLEPRTCPNCGASVPFGQYKCGYCGTTFKGGDAYAPLIVERIDPRTHVITTRVAIPKYAQEYMNPEQKRDYILSDMRAQIADALLGLIEVREEFNPIELEDVYEGRVRVIEPSFRY